MTTTVPAPTAVDPDKLMAFVFRAVDEVGATLNTALVVMGDKLGLYREMADGPLTRRAARHPHRHRRALRPGMAQRAGRGWIVDYDPAAGTYSLPVEHAIALTDESSPAFLPGFFQIAQGTVTDAGTIVEAARSGGGPAGTSTRPTCTWAASGSSAPATRPTS